MEADLVIVGGGIVGSALAAAICGHPSSRGLSVVLVDASPPDLAARAPISLRTTTVSPSSYAFLDEIGVWDHIPSNRIRAFDRMFVWDHPRPLPNVWGVSAAGDDVPAGVLCFEAAEIGERALGFVVDNDSLRHATFERLARLERDGFARLQVVRDRVHDIEFDESVVGAGDEHADGGSADEVGWPVVRLAGGKRVAARLLAACDGARSRVRTLCGGEWFANAYGQTAVVANVRLARAAGDEVVRTALQRFVATGPVAVLPVAGGDEADGDGDSDGELANVIWTTTRVEAAALLAADEATFLDELNVVLAGDEDEDVARGGNTSPSTPIDATGAHLTAARSVRSDIGLWRALSWLSAAASAPTTTWSPALPEVVGLVGPRASFPVSVGHAPRYSLPRQRTVLVGDAAHCVHPLAGQGGNLGFGDAQALADCVVDAAAIGRDFGGEDGRPLRDYERRRMGANVAMIGLTHALQVVFAQSGGSVRALRRVGMATINCSGILRRTILHAMR